jgi:mannonate dehydratase
LSRRNLLAGAVTAPIAATGPPAGRFWQPKLAENIGDLEESTLRWLAQLGLKWVDLQGAESIDRERKGWWSQEDLQAAQDRCRQFGLEIASITIPVTWQMRPMLGRPGRDEDIECIARSIRAAGRAGIPVVQYRWSPDFFWGPEMGYRRIEGRGGALYTVFDFELVRDQPPFEKLGPISYEELWERLVYFLSAIVPVAEQAGVKLAMHPKDPPQPVVRGIARLLTNLDQIERFLDLSPSPAHGFTLCQGTVAEMGVNVIEAIRRIGGRGRIHHVHFRNVRGRVPRYVETFIDEGDIDMLEAMRAYRAVGYTGAIVSDHTPQLTGDLPGGKMGRSFSHGYIRALLLAVNAGC